MVRGKLKTTIPVLSPEWSLKMTYKVTGTFSSWCSVLRVEQNADGNDYGKRTPAIFWRNDLKVATFASAVSGNKNFEKRVNIYPGTVYHVEFHQRYKSAGVYHYWIVLNGVEIESVDNTQAKQFHNVKVWTSDPNYHACIGTISDFEITNFL